jgi:DNA-binding IclR family transcriptional regulator
MRSDQRNGTCVLDRAFRLLEALMPGGASLSLSELARRAHLPKATAFRLANQLVELRALERTGEGYELGLRLFEFGSMVGRQRRLRDAALPLMEDLYEDTHETIHLGAPDALDVLYVEKIVGWRRSSVPTDVGTRKPLYCTGLGKAILSRSDTTLRQAVLAAGLTPHTPRTITSSGQLLRELSKAARDGVAYDWEEFKVGTNCVASPILDANGVATGALSVTGPIGRFNPESAATAVRTAATKLSSMLNGAHAEGG